MSCEWSLELSVVFLVRVVAFFLVGIKIEARIIAYSLLSLGHFLPCDVSVICVVSVRKVLVFPTVIKVFNENVFSESQLSEINHLLLLGMTPTCF